MYHNGPWPPGSNPFHRGVQRGKFGVFCGVSAGCVIRRLFLTHSARNHRRHAFRLEASQGIERAATQPRRHGHCSA